MNNRNIVGIVGGGGIKRFSHKVNYNNDSLFQQICSLENLFSAWSKFRRGKRKKSDVMIFGRNLEANIFNLNEELISGNYRHNKYIPFIIRDPKERQIHKATVKDRIVHQAVVNIIEPIFEKRFIFDSFSCRKGKGTHAASRRLRHFLYQASVNNTRTVYTLKCDVRRFFDSVDHDILFYMIGRRIQEGRTLNLLKHIIASFENGLPIGNLTSQIFANIYLHELDHFVKHFLKEKYYLRYCDDFLIIHHLREHLIERIQLITRFLREKLRLDIHLNKISIRNWGQGIDFVGYVHLPYCTVLRTKTKRRMFKRVSIDNLSSYLGLCKHADSFELQQVILNKVDRL